jgi:hypothetical protein
MRVGCVAALLLVVVGEAPAAWNLTGLRTVPEAVRQEADRAVPNMKWLVAFKDNTSYFKLVAKNALGRLVEFVSNAEGKDATVNTELSLDEVPSVVSSALKERKPYFQPKRVYKCCTTNGELLVYRFEGGAVIYVSPSGKKVTEIK